MNFLDDGTVLPSGLLDHSAGKSMAGFNKTYRNTAMRVGVIVATYPVGDDKNRTGLATEYDVTTIEQNEDKGSTTITYKNCIASSGLGGIADFFEMTLRMRETKEYKSGAVRLNQQDGNIVLIQCLDGSSDKALIIGGFPHPDRPTTLTDTDPQLAGEYNGVNVQIEQDGTTTFTWKGPTNNDASPVDTDLTPTIATVEADGSLQINHKTITFRMDIDGTATLTSTGDLDINCDNANVMASGDANITAGGKAVVDAPEVDLGVNAADAVIKGDTFKKMVYDVHTHPTPIGVSGPPVDPMDPSSLSKKVKTE
jgi:hypothetical protein